MFKYSIFAILAVWLIMSVARIPIYMVRAWENSKKYSNLSYEEKKHLTYGEIYDRYLYLDKLISKNQTSLYLGKDTWDFYLLRYLLYPKRITAANFPDFTGNFNDYSFIIVVNDYQIPANIKSKIIIFKPE